MASAPSMDITQTATAVSRQHAAMVDITADRYIVGARLLGETAGPWNPQTPEDRVKSIAAAELEFNF